MAESWKLSLKHKGGHFYYRMYRQTLLIKLIPIIDQHYYSCRQRHRSTSSRLFRHIHTHTLIHFDVVIVVSSVVVVRCCCC